LRTDFLEYWCDKDPSAVGLSTSSQLEGLLQAVAVRVQLLLGQQVCVCVLNVSCDDVVSWVVQYDVHDSDLFPR
jgi:hypothetical protein